MTECKEGYEIEEEVVNSSRPWGLRLGSSHHHLSEGELLGRQYKGRL